MKIKEDSGVWSGNTEK